MTAETVDLILYRFLETFHDKKRNNGRREPNGDAHNGYLMDGAGESFLVTAANSFGYKVG